MVDLAEAVNTRRGAIQSRCKPYIDTPLPWLSCIPFFPPNDQPVGLKAHTAVYRVCLARYSDSFGTEREKIGSTWS